jgi:fluoride ion exporter CrcB/FEX
MTLLLASLAGAVGAVCRYAVSGWAQRASRSDFPVGTLAVNLVGSFLVGATVGIDQLGSETSLMAVGFLGDSRPSPPGWSKPSASAFPARSAPPRASSSP